MKRIVVIGIGNLIMKDDGIGGRIVESIKSSLITHGITAVVGETDFLYCLNYVSFDEFLVILDAMDIGKEPGSIEKTPLSEALKNSNFQFSQHGSSLLNNLLLYYPNIKGYFIGIQVAEIEFGVELSKDLNESYARICATVLDMVLKMLREIGH